MRTCVPSAEGEFMNSTWPLKLYLALSGAIFLLVGLFHLLRLVYQWPVVVGARPFPMFLSYVGCPVSTGYALWAFWLLGKRGRRSTFSLPS